MTATKGQKAGARHPNHAPSTVHDQSLAYKTPVGEKAEQGTYPIENPYSINIRHFLRNHGAAFQLLTSQG